MAVQSVFEAERNNEEHMIDPNGGHTWINPSKKLVDLSINRWTSCNLRAGKLMKLSCFKVFIISSFCISHYTKIIFSFSL